MNYGELKTQFEAILNRTDITSTLTETFINQALARTQRELKSPPQEKTQTTTVTAGFTSHPVPYDYQAMIDLAVDDEPVQFIPVTRFRTLNNDEVGSPIYWTRIGSEIYFCPIPVEDAVITLNYYGEFTSLIDDTDETTLTVSAPDLLIYGALSYAADYYLDERSDRFEARFRDILGSLQSLAYDAEGSGAVQPAYDFGDD